MDRRKGGRHNMTEDKAREAKEGEGWEDTETHEVKAQAMKK